MKKRAYACALVVLTLHVFFATTFASTALAQQPERPPVAPVPYGTSQPVPYGTPPTPAPQPAQPQPQPQQIDAGNDIIYLKSGGILRGTIIDAIPNAHARIRLPTGEIATVQWAEVQKIVHATSRPAGPGPAPTPVPAPSQGMTFVHVDAPRMVVLEALKDGSWTPVCESPCDTNLSRDYEYRFTGGGMRKSKPFKLSGEAGQRITVAVDPGSSALYVLGIVGIAVSSTVLFFAGLIWLVAQGTCDNLSESACNTARDSGIVSLVSIATLVLSIVAVTGNSSTSVKQEVVQPQAAPPRAQLPQWREATGPKLPPAPSVPILSLSF